jgi:hypothetical protein
MAVWIEADDDTSNNSSYVNMDHVVKAYVKTIPTTENWGIFFDDVSGTTHQSPNIYTDVAVAEATLQALVRGYDLP